MHVKFLHSSDLQIGMRRSFLGEEAQPRFDAARIDAIAKLGEIAVAQGCSFIVIAGDVFEHNALKDRTILRALEQLKSLAVPVYLLSGNHDPLTADSYFYKAQELEGVTVFFDSEPIEVEVPGGTIELIGAPLKSKYASHDLVGQAIKDLQPSNRIRIVVGHGQVDSYGTENTAALVDLALVESKLKDGSIDYVAMGDTHSAQPIGTSAKVWFSGAPEVTDFHEIPGGGGENNSGHALVVEITKKESAAGEGAQGVSSAVAVTEVPVGSWRFDAITKEINSMAEAEEFIAELDAYPSKDRTVIKYALIGTVDIATYRFLENELGIRSQVFAALYERTRLMDLHLEPSEEDLEALGEGGFIARTLEELLALARIDDASDQATARDALNLLFRLSKEN
ncbi:exonuclease SbcCD subunit D [Corynebacterium sp. SCR221107]|uniref:metallophosphoesterase family protein n=1 Tax=Corynebacterium sp. SCR221107 TaxID=3017361 RepID=UPI0022EC899B|nr:exonuclease SbcCD subunit D [Corynebacterium sp. SCR221107]WBT09773.1 exonuclease SbcCD subunit D [Corynebacterium sp. SCR221107]